MLCLLIAALSAWLGGRYVASRGGGAQPSDASQKQMYTCSMHPQIVLPAPGDCPICAMPLVPVDTSAASRDGKTMRFSEHSLRMAGVETAVVQRRPLQIETRAFGRVVYDERTLATVTARFAGYAEKLFVNFTGAEVKAGDPLLEIFSPDLTTAIRELRLASTTGQSGLADASQMRLVHLGLRPEQVREWASSTGQVPRVTLKAPVSGTVVEKSVLENKAFAAGEALYRVADLGTVWLMLDVFEGDAGCVVTGQVVEAVSEAYPGRVFRATVSFVNPVLDEETRTFQVRAELDNSDRALKPGMYLRALLKRPVAPALTAGRDLYICTMCPEIQSDKPGECSKCGMALEKASPVATAEGVLSIPVSAVLDSGTRTLVYVEQSPGIYQPVEVKLGARAGDDVPVLSGLQEGQRVVVRGAFLLDSQFQIHGLGSLFQVNTNAAPANATAPDTQGAP